jgi:hypothetical protein
MVCRVSLRLTSFRVLASAVVLLGVGGAARAQTPAAASAPTSAPVEPLTPAGAAPAGAPPAAGEMPPPAPTEAPPPSAIETAPLAGTLAASPTRAPNVSYGVGARLRWVSVPAWMLNLFTKKNVPLSSWAAAAEFFRRKGEFDFIVSVGFQSLSPGDGNWLGRGHDASIDTDYVQFNGLGFWGVDASFVWHTYFNDWVGLHYGAGLGLGIVTGQMLRTSNGSGCTEANAGDVTKCHPVGIQCMAGTGCDSNAIGALGPGPDDPANPHRFVDPNVPPVLPIVNVLVGVDFRLPHVRGWEAKIEGGFYDAFFLGGGVGYTF